MITDSGVTIELSRIPRRRVDEFFSENPPPEIPTREVVIFGGLTEEVEDENDADYRRELLGYRLRVLHKQIDLILPYVDIRCDWENDKRFIELVQLRVCQDGSKSDFLRFVALNRDNLFDVIDELLYMSTTTERGVNEAAKLFNVTWNGKPILSQHISNDSPGKFSRMFEDREAARFAGVGWDSFVEMSRPEQSAILAHYRIRLRLDSLNDKYRSMKAKGKRV